MTRFEIQCHFKPCHLEINSICQLELCHIKLCHIKLCHIKLCHIEHCHFKLCTIEVCHIRFCHFELCQFKLCHIKLCLFILCYINLCHIKLCPFNHCPFKLCHFKPCHLRINLTTISNFVTSNLVPLHFATSNFVPLLIATEFKRTRSKKRCSLQKSNFLQLIISSVSQVRLSRFFIVKNDHLQSFEQLFGHQCGKAFLIRCIRKGHTYINDVTAFGGEGQGFCDDST